MNAYDAGKGLVDPMRVADAIPTGPAAGNASSSLGAPRRVGNPPKDATVAGLGLAAVIMAGHGGSSVAAWLPLVEGGRIVSPARIPAFTTDTTIR